MSPATPDAPERATVDIVMPAYNGAVVLERTLPAILSAARGRRVIVVDPGSTDDTAARAEALGAEVIRLGHRAGPAEARNRGVEAAEASVVLFIDADCVAHDDVVDIVERAFTDHPDLVTLTGSYDDAPPEQNFFSQYMNLRHHHTHQRARQEPATFWAGCGAVRVSAFREVGGYDAERFARPMIEDIELGTRLAPLGRMRLDPDLNVTHLKRWTARSVVTTDIFCRAVPWTRLIVGSGDLPDDLNTKLSARLAALVAPLALIATAGAPLLLRHWPLGVIATLVPIAVAFLLSFDLTVFFARRRGLIFALGAFYFHQVHLIYSAATFVIVALAHRFARKKAVNA